MNQIIRPIHRPEPITVPVEGMTCASCVRRVETAAAKVAGVEKSAVNFATKKLTVETGAGFDPETLEAAVRKMGYEIPDGAMAANPRLLTSSTSSFSRTVIEIVEVRLGSSAIRPPTGISRT